MSYRLNAGHSVPAEVSRILAEETGTALEQLRERDPHKRAESIHEARKSLKKLRAVLRLMSPHLDPQLYKAENRQLRDVGRKLSELRDADAIREVFSGLLKEVHAGQTVVPAARQHLSRQKREMEARVNRNLAIRNAVAALKEFKNRVNGFKLQGQGFELLEAGFKKSFKRGRKALKAAGKNQTAESFHEFRKRAKDHWYHVRLISELGSGFWSAREEQLKALTDLLGDEHNLVVLRDKLAAGGKRFASMLTQIDERRQHLRREALALGMSVYQPKWGELSQQFEGAQKLWPRKPPQSQKRTAKGPRHAVA